MKLLEVKALLQCETLACEQELNREVTEVVASDAMSEVLAFTKSGELMVTGLTNIQSIRTADIAGVTAVVYCRGRKPGQNVVDYAREKGIPVLFTQLVMFEVCGLLYKAGLRGVS
jgi:predicted transcriptional regulator